MRRLFLLLVLAGGAGAQVVELTADEIATRCVEALGGPARFASIDSIRVQGRMRFGQGAFSPFSVVAKRSGSFRLELTIGPDHVTQAYDGAIGWQAVSGAHPQEPTPLTGDSLAHLIDQAANAIGGPLVDRAKRRNRVEFAGREEVNGIDCYRLKVTLGSGDIMLLFIDPSNFRETQEELPMNVNGKAAAIQESVSDFRRFGPILVPCTFVTREKGGEDSQRLEIETVEINPVVEDTIFKLAAKK